MKKLILLTLALTLSIARSQQVTITSTTTYSIPPVSWTGADAQVILAQVAAITNAAGVPILATNSAGQPFLNASNLVPGMLVMPLIVTADDQGNLQSISLSGRK